MNSGRLEQVNLINKNIEGTSKDSSERIYSRSYILLITYGSLEKEIEDIFAKYLDSNNYFSNNYFLNNQIHRGLNYVDLKKFIKANFKIIVKESDYSDFNMIFFTEKEIEQYKVLIELRHNIAHQNSTIAQPSEEQVSSFIYLAIKLIDEIDDYLLRIQTYKKLNY